MAHLCQGNWQTWWTLLQLFNLSSPYSYNLHICIPDCDADSPLVSQALFLRPSLQWEILILSLYQFPLIFLLTQRTRLLFINKPNYCHHNWDNFSNHIRRFPSECFCGCSWILRFWVAVSEFSVNFSVAWYYCFMWEILEYSIHSSSFSVSAYLPVIHWNLSSPSIKLAWYSCFMWAAIFP